MSEEKFGIESDLTCQKCGLPLSQCTCSSSDRKIEIIHEFKKGKGFADKDIEAQLAEEKRKRESYEAIIALQAEKSFQDEKEAILDQFPEDRQEEIENLIGDDPEKLEQVRTTLAIQGSPEPSKRSGKAPAGKVPLPLKDGSVIQSTGQKNEYQLLIDDLYKKAKLSTDPNVQKDAERKIDELFEQYGEGFLQREKDYGVARRQKYVMTQCLKCGAFLQGQDADVYLANKGCNFCGFKSGFVKHPQGQPVYY